MLFRAIAMLGALALLAAACTSATSRDDPESGSPRESEPTESSAPADAEPKVATASPDEPADDPSADRAAAVDTTVGDEPAEDDSAIAEPPEQDGLIVEAQGITDDAIKISSVVIDLSALTEMNLAPEVGKQDLVLSALVDEINASGGVLGRRIELVQHIASSLRLALNPGLGRDVCIQATDDQQPFAVIVSVAIPASVVECIAQKDGALAIVSGGFADDYFAQSNGRLFALGSQASIRHSRLFSAWPRVLDSAGVLEGKTLGAIRTDTFPQEEALNNAVIPAVEELGYEFAAIAVLPCPEGSRTCEQHDVAIQRLKQAGVEVAFLAVQSLAAAATVAAAANLDFTPQWVTVGGNTTDTVARFFTDSRENYHEAMGVSAYSKELTEEAADCNQRAVAGGAEAFPPDHDGFNFTAVTCLQLLILLDAIDAAAESGFLSQRSVIQALEAMASVPMNSGPPGSLGPDKHDAGNYVVLSQYDMATEAFVPLDRDPFLLD